MYTRIIVPTGEKEQNRKGFKSDSKMNRKIVNIMTKDNNG